MQLLLQVTPGNTKVGSRPFERVAAGFTDVLTSAARPRRGRPTSPAWLGPVTVPASPPSRFPTLRDDGAVAHPQ